MWHKLSKLLLVFLTLTGSACTPVPSPAPAPFRQTIPVRLSVVADPEIQEQAEKILTAELLKLPKVEIAKGNPIFSLEILIDQLGYTTAQTKCPVGITISNTVTKPAHPGLLKMIHGKLPEKHYQDLAELFFDGELLIQHTQVGGAREKLDEYLAQLIRDLDRDFFEQEREELQQAPSNSLFR